MSIQGVNEFTTTFLHKLFVSQNATGNVAICGLSLYVMLGAINLGLRGSSHDQLSPFLGENFDDVFNVEDLEDFPTAERWSELDDLVSEFYHIHSSVHHSCDINRRYGKVSTYMFRLHKLKEDFSDPETAAQNLNEFIFEYVIGPRPNVFDESMIRENVLIFIDSLFISMDLEKPF
ncbi:hypothetical protein RF11_03592 [Thelohanellus kitauei]|uniref:Serpin domain-containing protein n=1 Tax=Thelohanellus kitauei TaxID=669202 RepID=A0A0C2MRL7_THEKT|nr:hypothetical protein RF11_03592 [Thelohanellus kitauei]